mmetsp:Transcript_11405/g.23382  ORF Transcript_11405/g.23382 Transcript_11405/m.23382 type:complete len:568 (-) Transcript_11405:123-1826(-)|eukprot:CAMPEP_0172465840 /NCGR_PEP_ID=MMETSP1065-20121228/54636_1 /TAXON_ID=265537 /ORGANISM="Amphiprora paludosa, Strain CCMP125" /LENGTH=567 /DNA_ID=CAMNT_0013222489 /DNA_START=217 /DNA_END=1920 /DNA_ORIENTATION=+
MLGFSSDDAFFWTALLIGIVLLVVFVLANENIMGSFFSRFRYWYTLHVSGQQAAHDDAGTILVIGGGLAGLAACSEIRCMDPFVTIILVEPKDYFETIWSAYRSILDEQTAKQSLFDLAPFCQDYRIQHVKEWVTELHETTAQLSNGTALSFDVALVAVGAETTCQSLGLNRKCLQELKQQPSTATTTTTKPYNDIVNSSTVNASSGGGGYTLSARLAQMKQEGDKILQARSVVIVGGGIVGCELAGDLMALKKLQSSSSLEEDVAVTLVHSGSRLCSRELGPSASRMVQEDLSRAGVRVILNEKAHVLSQAPTTHDTNADEKSNKGDSHDDDEDDDEAWQHLQARLQLQNSKEILEADEVVLTVGMKTANSFLSQSKPSWLDEWGWLIVDDSFQVTASGGRIFAVGDCCTLLPNSGSQVLHNSFVFSKNVHTMMKYFLQLKKQGQQEAPTSFQSTAPPPPNLLKYHLLPEIYVVTTSFHSGVAQVFGILATRWILPLVKNLTMFIFRPRTVIGIKNKYGWIFRPSAVQQCNNSGPKAAGVSRSSSGRALLLPKILTPSRESAGKHQ